MRRLAPAAFVALLVACAAPPPPPAPARPALPDLPPAETSSRRMALAVTVDDPVRAATEVEGMLKGLGGFVTTREAATDPAGTPRSTVVVLSVDARQAETLAARIKTLGTVTGERSQSDDVTADVVALNAKLAGQRGIEARLRAWTEGPDRDCAKLGEVERERAKVVDEIAALVARQRVQESRSQYAALAVRLSEPPPPPPPPPSFGTDVRRTIDRILSAPCAAAREGAATLIAWLPALLVLALVPVLVSRRRRARGHRPPGAPPAA